MKQSSIKFGNRTILNRYYDDLNDKSRLKPFLENTETAHETNNTNIYVHLRTAAESDSNFSCQWMNDNSNTYKYSSS